MRVLGSSAVNWYRKTGTVKPRLSEHRLTELLIVTNTKSTAQLGYFVNKRMLSVYKCMEVRFYVLFDYMNTLSPQLVRIIEVPL